MKISYSILTHNETDSLIKLIEFIVQHKDTKDEIVILDDFSDNEETQKIFDNTIAMYDIKFEQRRLMKDYAQQKNYLAGMCTGDFIFNIDADELPHVQIVNNIKSIIETNPTVDLFYVPRINTVQGLTSKHVQSWGWKVNEHGWINFPDWQGRIWRNRPNIKWERPVHEVLTGFKEYAYLPTEEEFSFYHPKDITRQEKQNQFYSTI